MQPIGRHGESYELTEFVLHEDALTLVDEYLLWFLMGGFPADSLMSEIRSTLLGTEA